MKSITSTFGQTLLLLLLTVLSLNATAQSGAKQTIAILSIDSRMGIAQDAQTMSTLVRLELEKTGVYTVLDRYEVADVLAKNKIDPNACFSKTCIVESGKLLGANKMLGGSIELLGEKVVINLRLIDVATGTIEKSDATEYLNLPEVQRMVQISVQKLVGLKPDSKLVDQLVNYDVPVQSPKNVLRLNGPRMGFAYVMGDAAAITTGNKAVGGFEMYPVSFVFGWQQEYQYISAGNFQALVENIFLISGLESGRFIPNYTPLLGFRFGKGAFEFAFGPTFRLIRKADGFYDTNGLLGEAGAWHLDAEKPQNSTYQTESRLDSRGSVTASMGLVIGLGKTFHSGYLNIPLNVYVAPRKDGTTVGATFGFNIQKKQNKEKGAE